MRKSLTSVAAVCVAGVLVASAVAGTIVGTARNDTLRGTAAADKLYGKAGNDKLYGLAGDDALVGGPGNDTLVGGAGADVLSCGPGKDVAKGDARDKIAKDCEVVTGLSKPPTLSLADASAAEGNAGATQLTFDVSLSAPSAKPISVHYTTADGSATAGSDYSPASGTLTIDAGRRTATIAVTVNGDTAVEPDETFALTLSTPLNATIARGSATGTITNDDVARPTSGHYAGTTSQGRALSFDVSPDSTRLSNLSFTAELNCSEVQGFTITDTYTLSGSLALAADWSFGFNIPVTYSDGTTALFVFGGKLALQGSAAGTLKINVVVPNVPNVGTVHCQTGDTPMTWTANVS